MTKGMKSSEFWLGLVLQVILFLNTTNIWSYMPAKYTVIVQGILGAAYMGSRGLAKMGTNSADTNHRKFDPTLTNNIN